MTDDLASDAARMAAGLAWPDPDLYLPMEESLWEIPGYDYAHVLHRIELDPSINGRPVYGSAKMRRRAGGGTMFRYGVDPDGEAR